MRKMNVCRRTVRLRRGRKLTLVYSITVDELADASGGTCIESYGACITVRGRGEEAIVRNITLSSSKIHALVVLLAVNSVTPSTLSDVVYDWLCRSY